MKTENISQARIETAKVVYDVADEAFNLIYERTKSFGPDEHFYILARIANVIWGRVYQPVIEKVMETAGQLPPRDPADDARKGEDL